MGRLSYKCDGLGISVDVQGLTVDQANERIKEAMILNSKSDSNQKESDTERGLISRKRDELTKRGYDVGLLEAVSEEAHKKLDFAMKSDAYKKSYILSKYDSLIGQKRSTAKLVKEFQNTPLNLKVDTMQHAQHHQDQSDPREKFMESNRQKNKEDNRRSNKKPTSEAASSKKDMSDPRTALMETMTDRKKAK